MAGLDGLMSCRCPPLLPAAGAVGRADVGCAAGAAVAFADCVWNDSFSLRTTGGSIVEDAERTNSPISVSLAITALLSTPNSFASS
jgi:hypothetical protein